MSHIEISNETITKRHCWQITIPVMAQHAWIQCKKNITRTNTIYRTIEESTNNIYVFGPSDGLIYISLYVSHTLIYKVYITYREFRDIYAHFNVR
jgi:hypothetical protein